MLNQQYTQKDILIYFLNNRKDVKLNLIIHLVFMIFGFETKKLYYRITNLLYKENLLRERWQYKNWCSFIIPQYFEKHHIW